MEYYIAIKYHVSKHALTEWYSRYKKLEKVAKYYI